MSADENGNDASPSTSTTASDETPGEKSYQELQEMLGELRAEVTRLKAQRAKEQAQNMIQRRPLLAIALSSALGAAVGYGAALATRPRPPTLSEQARDRLRGLADEARRVAGDVGRELSARAAESGEEARERARQTGRRLAQEAREVGALAQQEAQDLARRASDRARRAGADAGERLRQATQEASRQVREGTEATSKEGRRLGTALARRAKAMLNRKSNSGQEALSEVDDRARLKRSLWTIAGLAVGGYLAGKVQGWF